MRFPEFEGDWKLRKLNDLADKVNSGKTPLGGEAVYSSHGIPFIRSQNVTNDQLQLENPVFISEPVNAQMKNSVVKADDILLNITGASLGRSCVVPKEFEMGNVNQHVCIIRLNNQADPRFVQPVFSSEKGQSIFNSLQTGSGREGLNFESIKGIKLYIPEYIEQKKIASFLALLNSRIQTQSKIIEHLETSIKNLREKLLKQKLKFKNIEGKNFPDWEIKKLDEIGTFFSGGTPLTSKREYFNGKIPFIRSGEINSSSTEQYISEEGLKNSSAKMVEVGDLIYALYGATSGEVGISKIRGAINQAILCIRTNLQPLYLFNYLKFQKESIIKTYLQGGQGNLSAEIIKTLKIPMPQSEEQAILANFLSSLDKKIDAEKEILKQYEIQKKYLLTNLFI